jgi:Holliday junction resolvase RusA-like endonuclease
MCLAMTLTMVVPTLYPIKQNSPAQKNKKKISTYNPKKQERKKEKVKRIVRGRVNDQQYHFQS